MTSNPCQTTRRTFLARNIPLLAATGAAARAAGSRPNIILCMGDDHGWHETGYYKHPFLKTPALDEMASSGVRFDRYYAAAPVCSPTRGSVMTGRHPNRYGTFSPNHSIRPEEITLAHILRKAGYACGHFGKWHLGPVKKGSPTNPGAMGFDEWLSHDNFFGYSPLLSRNGAPPERFHGESSELVVREALRFIGEKAKQRNPFFTVIWFGSPHGPYAGMDEDLIPFQDVPEPMAHRFAEITALDRAMGNLRDFLRRQQLRENTMVWYCGDNGTPKDMVKHTKLRGAKGDVYEGGVRVPGILEWPAGIPKPFVTSVPSVTSDILPTICDYLQLPLPARPLDGISIKPLIGGAMKERPKPICFWRYDRAGAGKQAPEPYLTAEQQRGTTPTSKVREIDFRNDRHPQARTENLRGMAAVTDNRYKLVTPEPGKLELYDIPADLSESKDMAAREPAVVASMEKTLRDWQRSVEVSLTGADYR